MNNTKYILQEIEFKLKLDRPVEAEIDLTGDPQIDEVNTYQAIQSEIEWVRREIEKSLNNTEIGSVITGRPYQLAVEL
jgi:hypothetical protein